jgi:hypothetical protein
MWHGRPGREDLSDTAEGGCATYQCPTDNALAIRASGRGRGRFYSSVAEGVAMAGSPGPLASSFLF